MATMSKKYISEYGEKLKNEAEVTVKAMYLKALNNHSDNDTDMKALHAAIVWNYILSVVEDAHK